MHVLDRTNEYENDVAVIEELSDNHPINFSLYDNHLEKALQTFGTS